MAVREWFDGLRWVWSSPPTADERIYERLDRVANDFERTAQELREALEVADQRRRQQT